MIDFSKPIMPTLVTDLGEVECPGCGFKAREQQIDVPGRGLVTHISVHTDASKGWAACAASGIRGTAAVVEGEG